MNNFAYQYSIYYIYLRPCPTQSLSVNFVSSTSSNPPSSPQPHSPNPSYQFPNSQFSSLINNFSSFPSPTNSPNWSIDDLYYSAKFYLSQSQISTF